jgi:hypothetical protein
LSAAGARAPRRAGSCLAGTARLSDGARRGDRHGRGARGKLCNLLDGLPAGRTARKPYARCSAARESGAYARKTGRGVAGLLPSGPRPTPGLGREAPAGAHRACRLCRIARLAPQRAERRGRPQGAPSRLTLAAQPGNSWRLPCAQRAGRSGPGRDQRHPGFRRHGARAAAARARGRHVGAARRGARVLERRADSTRRVCATDTPRACRVGAPL